MCQVQLGIRFYLQYLPKVQLVVTQLVRRKVQKYVVFRFERFCITYKNKATYSVTFSNLEKYSGELLSALERTRSVRFTYPEVVRLIMNNRPAF